MDKTILVVDDEKEIRELLEIHLKNEGYNVITASNGIEALGILEVHNIDLIILDIMMPGIDGLQVCKKIREKRNLPILMLSAKSESIDKVQGILTGADDYLTKPFDSLELMVRVKALIRRTYLFNTISNDEGSLIKIENLIIDKGSHKVTVDEKEINLTSREFDILCLLGESRGMVFSSEQIFEKVWKEQYFQSNNTVMVHMSRLREKLNRYTDGTKIIHTVWGVGYKIEK